MQNSDPQQPQAARPETTSATGDVPAPDVAAAAAGTVPADAGVGAAVAQGEGEQPAAGPALEQQLADALAKAAENYDLFMRARAEMENVRRRAQEDVAKAHKFAIEAFAESLLPVRDSLEMALKADAPTLESLREGVQATLALMAATFEKNKLVAIDPAGEKFDPNVHQAISMVPVAATKPPVPANHVATVLQKGYLINERVLRPALVIVAQG